MNIKNDCEIVKDLLPNYIEKLTNPVTNSYIENHIKNCDKCANSLKNMNGELILNKIYQDKEIDFLKKVKRRNSILKKVAISLFFITIILIIIITIFILPNYVWVKDDNGKIDFVNTLFNNNQAVTSSTTYYMATQTIQDSEISENNLEYYKIFILQVNESTDECENYKCIIYGVTENYIQDMLKQLVKFSDNQGSKISNLQHNSNSYSYNVKIKSTDINILLNELIEKDDDNIIEKY